MNEKECILESIKNLKDKGYIIADDKISKELTDLQEDIISDFYTVVVLGEFKRGKSTLINALLGVNLLPSNVLPETATINAIMYSDKPKLVVIKNDGTKETGIPTNEYLQQFSANNNTNIVNDIKYIKIGYNSEILKKNIVLVDTPGVSDINEQRCEVTYRFIPKANAVLFLLDANSPLKKTEKEFFEEHLIKYGINNIIFVINKYDCVDEEEEEELLDDVKIRLFKTFCLDSTNKLEQLRVFPVSAKWAIQGISKNNTDLVNLSGIEELKIEMEEIVTKGNIEKEKIKNYKKRLLMIIYKVLSDLKAKCAVITANVDELKKAQKGLLDTLSELEENKINIAYYVNDEKNNIIKIINKSLLLFNKKITDEIEEQIQLYKGLDFKDFVEQRISRVLQRQLANWLATYSPNVDVLLKNMEHEIARGMSYRFQQKICLEAIVERELKYNRFSFDFNVQDVSNATTKAGVVAAGGAGLMMLVGGPLVMPFISMAAFPFLQRKFLEETLARAKDEILPDVMRQIEDAFEKLKNEIYAYVSERCDLIIKNAEVSYKTILNNAQEDIGAEIKSKEIFENDSKAKLQELLSSINELHTLIDKIQ